MKEASYYKPLPDNRVECVLCPHHCKIPDGRHGFCLTRINKGGKLIAGNYCRPAATAVDPIEKKPLFHFHPGSAIFSAGPNGCTFKCGFCQNYEIAQTLVYTEEMPLDKFVGTIVASGTLGIAYTYAEPIIWFETIMELGSRVREHGLKNVMVSNGFIEPGPLRDLCTVVDAWNIDIKSMNPDFYRRICKGSLEPVLRACEYVKKAGGHLEITNLLIPSENDDPAETGKLAAFIAGRLGADTPLHISRYFPRFHMDHEATPEPLLTRAWEIARERLAYVYVGNISAGDKENTRCPQCGELLIARSGYAVKITSHLKKLTGKKPVCGKCGTEIPIVL